MKLKNPSFLKKYGKVMLILAIAAGVAGISGCVESPEVTQAKVSAIPALELNNI